MKKFIITSQHDYYLDNYKEGETDYVDFKSNIDIIVCAVNTKDAIKKYFEEELCYNIDFNSADIEKNTLRYSVLVDSDNNEPNEEEIELWKKGKLELYSDNIILTIHELTEATI